MDAKVLMVNDHHGVYVPQIFAQQYALLDWGVTPEQVGTLLLGPDDNEPYWETWEEVLSTAKLTLEGKVYTLTQDGDLWAICPQVVSNEEYAAEFNGEMKPTPDDAYEYEVCAECLQALANDSWDNTTPLEEQCIRNGLKKLHEEHERVVPDGAEYGLSWQTCECCGALPGDRFRLICFDMPKEEVAA